MTTAAAKKKRPQAPKRRPLERADYPPGLVAIPCNDLARYHRFTNDMIALEVPDGTFISMMRSVSVVQNMNQMVKEMGPEPDWMWVIADDHGFQRDIVLRLLDKMYTHDLDIVAPLCTRRGPPFSLVAFPELAEDQSDQFGRPMFKILTFEDLPDEGGLVELVAAGTAGMLIRRRVLDAMEEPWFENTDGMSMNEDVNFCMKARRLGFKVWLDCDSAIGHIGIFTAWADRRDGLWGFRLDLGGTGRNDIFIAGGIRPDDSGAPVAHTGKLEW